MKSSKSEDDAPKFKIIDAVAPTAREVSERPISQVSIEGPDKVKSKKHDVLQKFDLDKADLVKHKIIHSGMRDTEALNAFRSIRHTLQSKMTKFNSVVLVSSISKGGGATFSAINLAAAFTLEQGKKALVIDCNLSDQDLQEQLGVEAEKGIYDYLYGVEENIENLLYPTLVPRVQMISTGSLKDYADSQVEAFTGGRMKSLIDFLVNEDSNRVIILDAPPILDSADTKVLAELSDHIVVTIPYGSTTSSKIDKTIVEFGEHKISGFVMVN